MTKCFCPSCKEPIAVEMESDGISVRKYKAPIIKTSYVSESTGNCCPVCGGLLWMQEGCEKCPAGCYSRC